MELEHDPEGDMRLEQHQQRDQYEQSRQDLCELNQPHGDEREGCGAAELYRS